MRPDLPALFSELADLPAKQRDQYYAEYAVDADSRRELERLFEHDRGTVDPVSQLVGVASRAWLNGDATGLRCGAFRLLSVLGSGGMGVVYMAERADGEVRQRAAVKLMQHGWTEPELPIGAAAISPDGKVVAYTDPLGVHYHYPASGETRLLPGTRGHAFAAMAAGRLRCGDKDAR